MNVGIIGNGGREHAICYALRKSENINEIYCFPGNAGTSSIANNIKLDLENFDEGNVIRTSINKINCFVLCKKKAETYYIICPVSFSNAMRSRLIQLIELS